MKYILAVVALSYGLQCLSQAAIGGEDLARRWRSQADKTEHEAQQPGFDRIRRSVEGLWFLIYLLIAYRLVSA